ncbi:uncharacterized protein SPPG_04967 [Spizellomyces punctatus DAOM BR117]|uniref:CBS domain-containing protein n=1 Tax=Spizellomyces punctatus (strain DAOM BR117) TaxID=645134 RepID=A0A0L0HFN1_SPIPD|nr:uncharacterized protein SPPG_04967 [Spizellomyces punctatus DAOM BR117]KNC99578.1 hypothetical protein SPPG_04967 [Spizellomyces punctatus DAOM BR117]|eukprot:XP_016607618.1 hypothetical protein SPPG_04967 [Spizellomyces punctatus DAOM BR117]
MSKLATNSLTDLLGTTPLHKLLDSIPTHSCSKHSNKLEHCAHGLISDGTGDDMQKTDLVAVEKDTSIGQVLEVLRRHDLCFLPVYEMTADNKRRYLSTVSFLDIFTLFGLSPISEEAGLQFDERNRDKSSFFDKKVSSIISLTPQSAKLNIQTPNNPIRKSFDILKSRLNDRALIRFNASTPATLTKDDLGESLEAPLDQLRVITQSDLIRWLHPFLKDTAMSSHLARMTAKDLYLHAKKYDTNTGEGIPEFAVHSFTPTMMFSIPLTRDLTAAAAFRALWDRKLPCCALVCPSTGRLEAEWSAFALRGLHPLNVSSMLKPALQFLKETGQEDVLTVVFEDDGFLDVVDKVVRGGARQVWIVDSCRRPVGVITCGDLVAAVCTAVEREAMEE